MRLHNYWLGCEASDADLELLRSLPDWPAKLFKIETMPALHVAKQRAVHSNEDDVAVDMNRIGKTM